MKHYLPLLLALLLFHAQASPARAEGCAGEGANCGEAGGKMDCSAGRMKGSCSREMMGRCGKLRGDWYGAGRPVASAEEARKLLVDYFAGQGYGVSEPTEGKWGFLADITGKDGKVIDRVMIDKRFGRIRSIY